MPAMRMKVEIAVAYRVLMAMGARYPGVDASAGPIDLRDLLIPFRQGGHPARQRCPDGATGTVGPRSLPGRFVRSAAWSTDGLLTPSGTTARSQPHHSPSRWTSHAGLAVSTVLAEQEEHHHERLQPRRSPDRP